MDWHAFWWGGDALPLHFIALRAVILYLAVVAATRLMHFRHVGVMARHNYLVAAAVVGISGSRILTPQSSPVYALAVIAFLTALGVFFSYLDLKLPRFAVMRPTAVIKYGKMEKANMRRANITIDNLLGQLRLHGVFNLNDVESAYLEATGKISVLKKPTARPAMRRQLNLPECPACPPTPLIYDGEVKNENLARLNLSRRWLEKELQKQGYPSVSAVFFAALLPDGGLYVCSH